MFFLYDILSYRQPEKHDEYEWRRKGVARKGVAARVLFKKFCSRLRTNGWHEENNKLRGSDIQHG